MKDDRPIVVTGGAGFIGSHVVDRLVAEGLPIVVVDDLSTGSPSNLPGLVPLEQRDLADPRSADWIARIRPSTIVHCAAQVSVTRSFQDPAADARSNIVGSVNVLQAAIDAAAQQFIYLSSGGALYGDPLSIPSREDAPVAPLSPYGWSKWIVERYLHLLATGRLSWTVLRLANVYGPRQRTDGEGGVVAIFADRMRRGLPVTIHGDGEQTRDFVFVRDVAEAVAACLSSSAASAVVNIGTGRETSVNQVFLQLARIASYPDKPTHVQSRRGDIRRSVLDVQLAMATLGWSATTTLEASMRAAYAAASTDNHWQDGLMPRP